MATYEPFAGFTHHPVEIAAQWKSKTEATRIPVAAQRELWQLDVQFDCALSPILLAQIVQVDGQGTYDRLHGSTADLSATVELRFRPLDWYDSDVVDVYLSQHGPGGSAIAGVRVHDRQVKADPRSVVDALAISSSTAQTGGEFVIAAVPSLGLSARVLLLAKGDTENARGRWRVRKNLAGLLPESYSFLLRGRMRGDLDDYPVSPSAGSAGTA